MRMRNFLTARWENLIMANYEVDPKILLPYLPTGTELDTFGGKTYVSLVGFLFAKTRIFSVPVPLMSTFEEVNLRFYVRRQEGSETRRGVVFINETVPHRAVAWLANKLYKEHYTAVPTRHSWQVTDQREIAYSWRLGKDWNHIKVKAGLEGREMEAGSIEEFIFEHYYGYTRVSPMKTEEYRVEHPRWKLYPVNSYDILCDFEKLYGSAFAPLTDRQPQSVLLAEGSAVSVKWKRRGIGR